MSFPPQSVFIGFSNYSPSFLFSFCFCRWIHNSCEISQLNCDSDFKQLHYCNFFVLRFDCGNAEERRFTNGFTKHKSDVQMKAEQNNTGLICWPLWSSRGLNVLLKSTPLVATGRRRCCSFTYMPIFFLLVQGSKPCHNFTSLTLEVNAAHIFI